MAKRTIKKSAPSIREKAEAASKARKPSMLSKTASGVAKPVRATGRGVRKVAKPFNFLLWPFRTRPVRFVGRIFAKIFLINYFRASWKELRKVTWPNRKQTIQLTLAVFAFALVFSVVIAVTDYGLDKIFRKVLLQ